MQAITIQVDTPADIESAITSFAREPNGGLIVPTGRLPTKQAIGIACPPFLGILNFPEWAG